MNARTALIEAKNGHPAGNTRQGGVVRESQRGGG